ncbi:MAG: hypothetical protein GY755_00995 [Chloroflexi bacterium]|nr:hypothetical protein [Chloroflexota bacterium]
MKIKKTIFASITFLILTTLACSLQGQVSSQEDAPSSSESEEQPTPPTLVPPESEANSQPDTSEAISSTFKLEAWADNWFAAYLGDTLIVEDSVSITTERSFNAETATFEASYPLSLNFILKDFKENDTGLEYIGSPKQQMGDGGFIMQLTDMSTGEIVALSNADWSCTVIHEAPLDKSCESQSNPTAGTAPCEFTDFGEPAGWKSSDFDDSTWTATTVHSSNDVRPKDGYDQIRWDANAEFIWGPDLETNNTLLCRTIVLAPLSNTSADPEADSATSANPSSFSLISSDVAEGGSLPTEYTCDGERATLPLLWEGAPVETQSFALVMHHVPGPGDTHWYWILYDIPADITSLSKNSIGVGTLGTNSVNGNTEYAPPCSKGPGEKSYTYTVYALSAEPQFSVPASQIDRDALLNAIQHITLASTELNITYTR